MRTLVEVELLDRMQVKVDGEDRTHALPGVKGRLLVARLALSAGRPVSRGQLAEALWEDEPPPADVAASLRTFLCRVRQAVGADHVAGRYAVSFDDVRCDAGDARDGLLEAEAALVDGHTDVALAAARRAARDLLRPLAPELEAGWLDAARRDREDLAIRAHVVLADAALEAGHEREAVDAAMTAARLAPWSESVHLVALRTLARAGERAAGLRLYEALRTRLGDELGAVPNARLRAAHAELLADDEDVVRPLVLAA